MASTVSSLINGGERVTPHIALTCRDRDGKVTRTYKTKDKGSVVSKETSEILRGLLHQVVAEGTGKNGQVAGFAVGGKTATICRCFLAGAEMYIASFIGFAPAEDPEVLAIVIIHEPQGIYYGGTIAAPVCSQLFGKYPALSGRGRDRKKYG